MGSHTVIAHGNDPDIDPQLHVHVHVINAYVVVKN